MTNQTDFSSARQQYQRQEIMDIDSQYETTSSVSEGTDSTSSSPTGRRSSTSPETYDHRNVILPTVLPTIRPISPSGQNPGPIQMELIGAHWFHRRAFQLHTVEDAVNKAVNSILGNDQIAVAETKGHDHRNQTETFLSDDEDDDMQCIVCQKQPPEISISHHKALGGFANHHILGSLDQNKQVAIITATITKLDGEGNLNCRFCHNWHMDTTIASKVRNIQHLAMHGICMGANPTLNQALDKIRTDLYICIQCGMVFPSQISLILHAALSVGHDSRQEIFCNSCKTFVSETTIHSHHQEFHDQEVNCPSCNKPTGVMETLFHYTNSSTHPELTLQMKKHLSKPQVRELNQKRNYTYMALDIPSNAAKILALRNGFSHEANQVTTPGLFQALTILDQNYPQNQGEIVANQLPRPTRILMAQVLKTYNDGVDWNISNIEINQLNFEITTAVLGTTLKELFKTATETPANLDYYLFGILTDYPGCYLFPPSILNKSREILSPETIGQYDLITCGNLLLNQSGTSRESGFRVLNLGPTKRELLWPTNFFTHPGEHCIQGALILKGEGLKYIPVEKNYLQYVWELCKRIRVNTPVCVEFNIFPYLKNREPHTWNVFLEKNLLNIASSFFTGLARLRQETTELTGNCVELVVLGQGPFSAKHEIPAKQLIALWQKINQVGSFYARTCKIVFLPTSGMISFGVNSYTNVLINPSATFNQNEDISNYTRHQTITILQLYTKIKQTVNKWKL